MVDLEDAYCAFINDGIYDVSVNPSIYFSNRRRLHFRQNLRVKGVHSPSK